ncbi:hypothetical protein PanWU01x14_072610 [Parasponia andersonii]|uniref:Uncharacterized protein n=1 Tax=Parasponia andersonii TaxID=3476 RepID=A0A2P5DDU6_PARAD|nr:hypothetical protein PanWU01x14_072610 [Parasponia andersonii]
MMMTLILTVKTTPTSKEMESLACLKLRDFFDRNLRSDFSPFQLKSKMPLDPNHHGHRRVRWPGQQPNLRGH